ncbi:hypothetical protein F511_30314 [Dorcoceras hygrometricum]|uniref:Uncharacterized protein n=1 Tax=Dorcoceras hygrometricum TaxID=472368 RepID=A0A2Z7BI89_9LAMI|nr:hypothetical protein F511_30314 [Dorcoceras hygrometricum]
MKFRAHKSATCSTVTYKTSGTEAQKATAGSYELNQRYTTPSNLAESSKQRKTASRKRPKASSKRSVSAIGVQRYHSYFNRSCLLSAIEEDKRTRPSSLINLIADRNWIQIHRQLKLSQLIFPLTKRSCNRSHSTPKQRSLKSNDVAESYCRKWICHPLLTAEQRTNICSQHNNRSLTQLKLTQLTVESSSLIQNAVVPTNPNDDVLAPATESTLSHHGTLATTDLATTAEFNHSASTADVTTAERLHSAMTHANY